MKRIRFLAITAAAAAVLALSTPMAAQAVTPPPATGTVTVAPQYQPSSGGPVGLIPDAPGHAPTVDVEFWQLDAASQTYSPLRSTDVTWSGPASDGSWSAVIPAGAYRIQFIPSKTSVPSAYWTAAGPVPFLSDVSTDTSVSAGATVDLGTFTIPEGRSFATYRTAGADRFATAVAASQEMYPDPVTTPPSVVYVANGYNYPDALAAGPAAIRNGAPLLLTAPNALPSTTAAELARLHPQTVVLVGGPAAASASVLAAIQATPGVHSVTRVGGADRYQTADMIVGGAFSSSGIALIATGRNYPDALAAGPAAGYMGAPVILVDGSASAIPQSTLDRLTQLGVAAVGIVGGANAVSSGIEAQLSAKYTAAHVHRFSGSTRYETAAALNQMVFGAAEDAFLASGANFPDALAGAPLAGAWMSPLYLTQPDCLGAAATQGIYDLHVNGIHLLGGTAALSSDVENVMVCGGVVIPSSTASSSASAPSFAKAVAGAVDAHAAASETKADAKLSASR